jgi:hypothetical protein
MTRHRASIVLALALALAAPGSARAEPSPQDQEAAARAVGDEALHRFNAARWQEAYELFQRADRIFHAPTLVLYMGHCRARLGDARAAWRLYRSVAEEPLAEGAPLQFQTARGVARELLASMRRRLFIARIVIAGAPAGGASVLVDGRGVPASELDDLPLEPGEHVVTASVPGGPTIRRDVTALAGGATEILLTLSPPALSARPSPPMIPATPDRAELAKAPSRPEPAPTAAAPPAPRRSPSLLVPAGVAFGLGGAALVAGTITGVISLRAAADVKARCNAAGQCPPSDQAAADRAGQLADASTGNFVAGGLAVATGIVLVVVDHRAPRADTAAVHLTIGLGYGAVGGTF